MRTDIQTDPGWEELTDDGYTKVLKTFPSMGGSDNPIFAKKVGRKTIFARYHGVVTFYVAGDDGFVYSWREYSGVISIPNDIADALVQSATLGVSQIYGVYRNGELVK